MNQVTELVLKNTKTFEECAMSDNPKSYIQSLPDSYQKKLLSLIINDHSQKFQETLKELNLSYRLKGQLERIKTSKKIQQSENLEEINYLLKDRIKEMKEMLVSYSKPAQYHSYQGEEGPNQKKLPSQIQEKKNISEFILSKFHENQRSFYSFTDYGIKSLPKEILLKMDLDKKETFLNRQSLIQTYSPQFLVQFLVQYYQEKRQKNKKYEFSQNIFRSLSLSHLEQLQKSIPQIIHNESFLSSRFRLKFSGQLEEFQERQLTFSQQEKKRLLLQEILNDAENIKTGKLILFKDKILKEILFLDLQINNVKEELFMQFIEKNESRYSNEAHLFNVRNTAKPKDQAYISLNFQSESMNNHELIEKYLEKLCLINYDRSIITRLSQYFKEEKILKTYARIKLKQGEHIQDVDKILSQSEIRDLKESKEITILEKTKKSFDIDEDIILNLRVKNVEAIKLKVYEIDLETHYIKDGNQINPKENLSYLNPTFVLTYKINNQNHFKENVQDLIIEKIEKKRGVYIVELEGEGITSRAFIRKGAIVNSLRITSAGTEIKFEDEKGNAIYDLTVWLANKKHDVKEQFIIPFSEKGESHELLVMKDNFYERFRIYVPAEQYLMRIGYIFGSESFIAGNKAKVILYPRLCLETREKLQVSLSLLEDIKIKVDMVNNQDIKSNIEFDKVEFVQDKDYVLQIPIQSHLQMITINVEASIKKYTGEKVQLRDRKHINIDLEEDSTNFIDFYLKKVDSSFHLFALGKNGEQIQNFDIRVQQKLLDIEDIITHQLMTDEKGRVNLGSLESTERIQVFGAAQRKEIGREWILQDSISELSEIQNMIYKEGKIINLPFSLSAKLDDDLFLIRKNSLGMLLGNQTNKCRIVNSRLLIENLLQGKYQMYHLKTGSILYFQVIKGDEWEKNNQIYSKKNNTIYKIPKNPSHQICLDNAIIQEESNENIITIPLQSGEAKIGQKVRAHIYASNFMQPTTSGTFNVEQFRDAKDVEEKTFVQPKCLYFNNKSLGEEASYVLNREKEKHQIGNNLEKPKIFLKNVELRQTNEEEEQLQDEIDYEERKQGRQIVRLQHSKKKKKAKKMDRDFSGKSDRRSGAINKSLTSHNNFIKYSAWVGQNEKGQLLKFRIPKQYSHFKLFVLSDSNVLTKEFSKGDLTVQTKNVSHSGMRDESAENSWTMSREVYPVQAGEQIKVGRSSTWCSVSLANIINFARIKGFTLDEWVSNWQIYSWQQKEKVYDKKVCHELNCYIKHNDEPFFDKVVKPFISNKIKKTFIDYYLLDSKECETWLRINSYLNLNAYEKVLLVRYLIKNGMEVDAEQIAKAMDNEANKTKINFQMFKNQFQTVIYAKAVESAQPKRLLQKESPSYGMACSKRMEKSQEYFIKDKFDFLPAGMYEKQCAFDDDEDSSEGESYAGLRNRHRRGFKEMEKTKQYGEKTYEGVKYESETKNLVQLSRFWAAAALFFVSKGKNTEFMDKSFMYLNKKVEFTLASTLLSKMKNAQFDLQAVGDNYLIKAQSPFLVFVKELKSIAFEKKFAVFLNQRFFNPEDKYKMEDDGTEVEKQVNEFVVCRPYCLQTLITNTSGTPLELQLLIDLPEGSVPLKTHEYTKIVNINLKPYTTMSFERFFYFPREGAYQLYPANVCRVDQIIARAEKLEKIVVKLRQSRSGKMESFADVMRSGDQEAILKYVEEKNIHDQKLFDPHCILWMLKEKSFYERLMPILKKRRYMNQQISLFAFLHQDLATIKQMTTEKEEQWELPIFEYFPYYSSRAHMFLNENKSKIRNVQFRNSYFNLLFAAILNNDSSSRYKITLVYYLLLQDRIDEAQGFFNNRINASEKANHQLQADYIQCFIDMYKGYPNFERARELAPRYENYPVSSWRKLFEEINHTLKEHDGDIVFEEPQKEVYQATYICEEEKLRINVPEKMKVNVHVYDIKLEMYFSEFPFENLEQFGSSIKASEKISIEAGDAREELIKRKEAWRNPLIEIMLEDREGRKSKLGSFLWSNPKLKVRVREQEAQIQVIYEGRRLSGCYCKVYQMKHGSSKFYRDGYTDITGTFKYVLAGLEGVTEFAILVESQYGGRTYKVKPPSQQGYLQ